MDLGFDAPLDSRGCPFAGLEDGLQVHGVHAADKYTFFRAEWNQLMGEIIVKLQQVGQTIRFFGHSGPA